MNKRVVTIIVFYLMHYKAFAMDPEQAIYNNTRIYQIFNTGEVIEECTENQKLALKEFMDYSAEKQQDFLINEYNLIKARLIKSYLNRKESIQLDIFYRNSKLAILSAVIPASLFYYGEDLLSDNNLLKMGAAGIAVQGISVYFMKSLEALSDYLFPSPSIISNYETLYMEYKPFYLSDFQSVFENKVLAARKNTFYISEYMSWFKTALAIPLFKKPISKKYIKRVENDEILKNLGEDILLSIKRICKHHHNRENTRNIVYFYGAPGVGKTKSVERIALALGIPLGKILFSKLSHNELLGMGGMHQAAPGKILEAITHPSYQGSRDSCQSYANMVILIDEADRVLNDEDSASIRSLLLSLLDPETMQFYSPYLESHINIKNMLFILTGNEEIKDHALTDRMESIHFPGFSQEQKFSVGCEEIYKLMNNSKIDQSEFNESRQKLFKHQITKSSSRGLRDVQRIARSFVDSLKEEEM